MPVHARRLLLHLLATLALGSGLSPRSHAEPPAPQPQAQNEPHRDRYGDPLPPGAIARLGTLRFRAPGEIISLALTPDSKTIAVASYGGLFLVDAASGKRLRELASRDGHWGGREPPIVFAPDGKRLARRGRKVEGKQSKVAVFVWDLAAEGKPRPYDAEHVIWIGWTADGEPLAVCLEKDAVRLRELISGRSRRFECKNLRQPQLFEFVVCVCSPAGKMLAVVDQQKRVHIWDTATGQQRCILQLKKNAYIHALVFSPDGRILVSLTRGLAAWHGSKVQLWDANSGTALRTLATEQTYFQAVAFTADGKTLATIGTDDVRFWDTATGQERGRTQGQFSFSASFALSRDGQVLIAAESDSSAIHVWDTASGRRQFQPAGHRSRPNSIACAPDGRRVATGGGLDDPLYIWDLESGESITRITRSHRWLRNLAFSPDGRGLFSSWSDDEIWISGTVSGAKQHVLKLADPAQPNTYQSAISLYQSADNKTLVSLSFYYDRKTHGMKNATLITGWDASTHKQLFRRCRPGMESWVALSADARVLAVPHPSTAREMGPGQGPMRLEDVASGELLLTFPALDGQTWPLAFSPDGRLLAANNFNRKHKGKKGDPAAATGYALHLWETATAAEVLALPLDSEFRIAFSPNGRRLALVAAGPEILVYDLAHGHEPRRLQGFAAGVSCLAFSPDGRRLVSGLFDSTLLVWDVGPGDISTTKLGTEGVAKAWAELAGADAPRAFRARWVLATAPQEAVPFVKEHLHPVKAADPQRLQGLLADLDSKQFSVREKAQEELQKLGDLAEPSLRQTLANKPALEVRRRVQELLERLHGPVTRPELLQSLRAVAVLEDIGTTEARRLLENLAKGAPEARLTREAKASLQRLISRGRAIR